MMLYFLCRWHYYIPNFKFLAPQLKSLNLIPGRGREEDFWSGAYFNPKYLFFHKTYKAATFSTFQTFT